MNIRTTVPASSPRAGRAQIIASDAETIEIVTALAARFRKDAIARDRQRALPRDEIEALTAAGFFGATVPKAFGGADISSVPVANAFRILANSANSRLLAANSRQWSTRPGSILLRPLSRW